MLKVFCHDMSRVGKFFVASFRFQVTQEVCQFQESSQTARPRLDRLLTEQQFGGKQK
jgi:hypothetical protein